MTKHRGNLPDEIGSKVEKQYDNIYVYLAKKEEEENILRNKILTVENESRSVKHIVKHLEVRVEKLERQLKEKKRKHWWNL